MKRFPSIFISHGSPMLPLEDSSARDFLQDLGRQLGSPKAIVCISAHWSTAHPSVTGAAHPQSIHDFYGFPEAAYQLNYSPHGEPELATRVTHLLKEQGIESAVDTSRGLDHGVWNPLLLMYPKADVPVIQLSVQTALGPAHHWAVGEALAPLRKEGVLILGSGGASHNLQKLWDAPALTPDWVHAFIDWLNHTVLEDQQEALIHYRQKAPHAVLNHPTEEHLLPLFVARGAGEKEERKTRITLLHSSFTHSILSMAAYAFE
jgi:4,5-DOPA dioxygenase extradiol